MFKVLVGAGFALALIVSCTSKKESAPTNDADPQAKAISRGKAVYMSACIACHNADPKVSGALGPDVAGSSKELLDARIMRAEYPAGYKPKRDSKTMVALPHLKDDIESLTAYLNSL